MRESETYEVFAARAGREYTLQHVGNVRGGDPKVAAAYAHAMYDEWRWKALFVIPRRALIYVKKAD